VAYLVSNNHRPCIHSVETTIRQDAIYSVSNSLNINHREKDLPSLRPVGANKTPLQRFAKCPSIESMRTYTHRKSTSSKECTHLAEQPKIARARSRFLFMVTLEVRKDKGCPSAPIFLLSSSIFFYPLLPPHSFFSCNTPLYDSRLFSRFKNYESIVSMFLQLELITYFHLFYRARKEPSHREYSPYPSILKSALKKLYYSSALTKKKLLFARHSSSKNSF